MSDDREVWEMEPKGMMEYFQSSKHKLGESIADLVDNAFDAGAHHVEIEVSWYGEDEKPYIAIFDDGDGMDAGSLSVAMSLAKRRDDRPETRSWIVRDWYENFQPCSSQRSYCSFKT